MRQTLTVGILKESKRNEKRAPLTPSDVAWLKKRLIHVEVESDSKRIFSDAEYKRSGATIVKRCHKAMVLVGVKEPMVSQLQPGKVYMVFSHTIKGQIENIPLLKACIKKGITLIDYERIAGDTGRRLVYFGKFAGVCGIINSLSIYGKKLKLRGINNPFAKLKLSKEYKIYERAQKVIKQIAEQVHKKGLNPKIAPFIIGLTGHGNVGQGVVEILKLFKPIEIHPRDIGQFVRDGHWKSNKIYQVIFDREEKIRHKGGKGYYFEEYLKCPERFESNMDHYLSYINILLHTSYWDRRFPRLVTNDMLQKIYSEDCRLDFIADISCDIKGAIQMTHKTTTEHSPVYTYNPEARTYRGGYKTKGVTILARDNLPAEFPRDSSSEFSSLIREYVYQVAAHGATDITNHVAIPKEIRNATIVQRDSLTKAYSYLKKYL